MYNCDAVSRKVDSLDVDCRDVDSRDADSRDVDSHARYKESHSTNSSPMTSMNTIIAMTPSGSTQPLWTGYTLHLHREGSQGIEQHWSDAMQQFIALIKVFIEIILD
jgi:hypothetical protein